MQPAPLPPQPPIEWTPSLRSRFDAALHAIGRLDAVADHLIALQLAHDGLLREPMLYVSLHFKEHRRTYYELLNAVRLTGDWEAWLEFFADAVIASATQVAASAGTLLKLTTSDAQRIEALGRAAGSALAVHQVLQRQPLATASSLVAATRLTAATVNRALAHLERIGVVAEITGRRRDRVFSYAAFVDVLNEGMDRPGRA